MEGSEIAIEHLVAIDAQDAELYAEYLQRSKDGLGEGVWFNGHHESVIMDGIRLEVGEDNVIGNMPSDGDDLSGFLTAVNKVNRLAARARGQWLFFVADDFAPVGDDWLPLVATTLTQWNPTVDKIVLSPERDDRPLVNHPIMSRAFYDHQGWFFCPEYLHVCVDSDLHYVATLERALREFPPEVYGKFRHDNPYLTRDAKSWDKVYGIGNHAALYEQGNRVFTKRKATLSPTSVVSADPGAAPSSALARRHFLTSKVDGTVSVRQDPVRRGLNVGCGAKPKASTSGVSWTNMDHAAHVGVDVVRDVRRGFPFSDDTFDEILMDNVLEHFVSEDVIFLLNELHRVARPGARVTIIVPHAQSQGAVQDPTHKSLFVPRSALYWNQHDTPYGGERVGITANLRSKSITVSGDMGTEAFITFVLAAEK